VEDQRLDGRLDPHGTDAEHRDHVVAARHLTLERAVESAGTADDVQGPVPAAQATSAGTTGRQCRQ
jgi:hypothetical protein